jgi:hypothetical protein
LSDWPLDENEGGRGDTVIEVEFDDLASLAETPALSQIS